LEPDLHLFRAIVLAFGRSPRKKRNALRGITMPRQCAHTVDKLAWRDRCVHQDRARRIRRLAGCG
jgi:hypothetical protein